MRKILVVITTAFVPSGGLATVMLNYYRAMDKDGMQIDFASTNEIDHYLFDELKANNSSYYCLGKRSSVVSYGISLWKVLKRERYDVIHVNANSATASLELLVAKFAGVQFRIVHNHTSKCDHWILHSLLKPIYIKLYTCAIACSRSAGDWIFGKDRFVVLSNSIDAEKYRYSPTKRNEIRDKYEINEDTLVIGHVGKIYEPKNHFFLLDVFSCYNKIYNSDSKLLLVGDGTLRENVERKAEALGLKKHVIFAGMQKDVSSFLSSMDIFVFPSLWEGLPLSVVEAQASGLECFISDRIDESVILTKWVNVRSLNEPAKEWAKYINLINKSDRMIRSQKSIDMIKQAKYDSKKCGEELRAIYDMGM